MYPNGYHHNGFMATPALGTQEVFYTDADKLTCETYTVKPVLRDLQGAEKM